MSRRFYLNDCLPANVQNGANVITLFRDMVSDYREMHKNQALGLEPSWVMSDSVNNVMLCGVALRDILTQLKSTERELYGYASRLVTSGIQIAYEEEQLADDPELQLIFEFNGRDAHNLLVAQKLNMIAASLLVEKPLAANKLQLVYTDPTTDNQTKEEIDNWFVDKTAGVENTAFIVQMLTPPLPPKTQPLDRLIAILGQHGSVQYSDEFKKDWDRLGAGVQKLIVKRFEVAIDAGLLFPANDNNMDIVKPDQKDKTSKVHELRQKGDGFRVYFECDANAIYLALYGTKVYHHGADQDADFRIAKTVVERMRKGVG